jgi:hypothetical protein
MRKPPSFEAAPSDLGGLGGAPDSAVKAIGDALRSSAAAG